MMMMMMMIMVIMVIMVMVMMSVDSLDKVHNDMELQNWGTELCRPKEDGGAGLKVSLPSLSSIDIRLHFLHLQSLSKSFHINVFGSGTDLISVLGSVL